MTNAAKATVWNAVWLPWGGVHSVTGTETLDARFPGQWFQIESGLHYNWHRHYDPTIGRYTQPDPLGFVDGPGLYSYVLGNPLTSIDLLGLVEGGHHLVVGPIRSDPSLSAAARSVFNAAATGPIPGGHNYTGHQYYNQGVIDLWNDHLKKTGINPTNMTAQQAQDFVNEVRRCPDPRVREFNNRIYQRIFNHALRRIPYGRGGLE
jgi:RHS repeat-associated protein